MVVVMVLFVCLFECVFFGLFGCFLDNNINEQQRTVNETFRHNGEQSEQRFLLPV